MSALLAKLVGTDAALPDAAGSLLVAGLTADSREVEPGFAFAALPGTKVDGARFIGQAFAPAPALSLPMRAPTAVRDW